MNGPPPGFEGANSLGHSSLPPVAMGEQLDYALDLMRRLPPTQIENNLAGLIDLVPHLMDDLLSAVDQPLKIAYDQSSQRDYLLCDYNRDGDSFRYASFRHGISNILVCSFRV